MNFEPFREKCLPLPKQYEQLTKSFCNKLQTLDDHHLNFQDPDFTFELFHLCGTCASKSQFYRKKRLILLLYTWLLENGKVSREYIDKIATLRLSDVISVNELKTFYFKSLDSTLEFISEIGSINGLDLPTDLVNLKSIVILAWNSVTLQETINLLKSDLDIAHNAIHIRGDNERIITLESKYFEVLRLYANEDEHNGFPTGKKQVYLPSPYLFRSARRKQIKLSNARSYLKRFNDEAKKYRHKLGLPQLRKNSVFCKILEQDDGNKTINSLAMELKNCERAEAYAYAQSYMRWKQLYHS